METTQPINTQSTPFTADATTAVVRYQVQAVGRAIAFYCRYLGFFLTGAMLYRHRDLLPAFGGRGSLPLAVANLAVGNTH